MKARRTLTFISHTGSTPGPMAPSHPGNRERRAPAGPSGLACAFLRHDID